MMLRLLDSPRLTQDLDFTFLSKESKKVIVKEIISALKKYPSLEITREDLNSRGIFLNVLDREKCVQARLELNVVSSTHLPSEPVSTRNLSALYSLAGRIVQAMSPAEAFSN